MISPRGWVRRNTTKDCGHKLKDYWKNKLSDLKKKRLTFGATLSVFGRGKRYSVDGIQPVEFQSFLLKKVESARNSIRAREDPIYLAHAQKCSLQMYKCSSNEGFAYLTLDLVPVASLPEKQRMRSAESKDAVPNKHKLKSLRLRRFSVSGPKLRNNLPNSLKSSSLTKLFCRSLKTYVFNKPIPSS